MYEAYGIDRREWWCELTIEQVRLRLHVAEKRIHDRAKMQANEIAGQAIDIMRKMKIIT